jgi:AcrR family transcriptional regulator
MPFDIACQFALTVTRLLACPSMDTTTGLRERKKQRTRATLAREALRLYTEQGFAETTIEQVAAAADVSPRTFFRYFATKEDAVLSDHEARLAAVRDAFAVRDGAEPISAPVRRALLGMLQQVTGDRAEGLARAVLVTTEPSVAARSLELQGVYEDEIARAIAERLAVDPETDPRPRVVAGAALGALRAAMGAWVRSGGEADPRGLIEGGLRLLETGIGMGPGTTSPDR